MRRTGQSVTSMKWVLIAGIGVIAVGVALFLAWPTLFPSSDSPEQATSPTAPSSTPASDASSQMASTSVECGDVLYSDDFSDPGSGWRSGATSGSEQRYADDGTYRMSTETASNVLWSWAPINQMPTDYCLSVRVQERNEGADDDGKALAAGLVFAGQANPPRFITADVAPASSGYRVRQRDFTDDATPSNLVDWTSASASEVRPAGEWNELQVRVSDGQAQLWINGKRLQTVSVDETGAVGVVLESFDETPVSAAYEDFTIRAITDAPATND